MLTREKKKRIWIALVGLIWIVGITFGMFILANHEKATGETKVSLPFWPQKSQLSLDHNRPTLIMFAHPKCPCTRASMEELARLMAQCQTRLSAKVLFVKPEDTDENWEQTDIWQQAAAIPGVTVSVDANAKEAKIFGALTSGQTLLYDASGKLIFHGGITLTRGHAGDNPGRDAITDYLLNGKLSQDSTPVFGCALYQAETKH